MPSNPLKDHIAESGGAATQFLTPATAAPKVADKLARQAMGEEEEQAAAGGEETDSQEAGANETGNEEQAAQPDKAKGKEGEETGDEIDLKDVKTFADFKEAAGLDEEFLTGLTVGPGR